MRESKFILQNREKWQKYEEGIRNNSLAAEDMERAFVELNDDLAFARTFYRNRAVRLFLNNLLAPVYTRIYSVRKWNWAALGNFFTTEAPLMNFRARKFILFSFIVVVLGFSIGFLGTRSNMEFASTILGEDYVRVTENNISRGDPLAIYKYETPGDMFIHIALNNLTVAFYFFMFGALFCVGSIYLLLSNGIMLGVFTYMFTSKGLTGEYVLTVYQHGTLEILSMVIEGAAGIMMGAGFLFPGSKSRLRSIQDNAKKSILMFLVCIPIIVLAAFIESYLTRFTELPDALRIAVISLSLFFMLGYFIVLPWYKFRNNREILGKYDQLQPDEKHEAEPGRIYNVGRITIFAFDHIKKNAGSLLLIALVSVLFIYPLADLISNNGIKDDIKFQHRQYLSSGPMADGEDASPDVKSTFNTEMRLVLFDLYSSCYFFSAKTDITILFTSFILLYAIVFALFYFNRKFVAGFTGKDPPLTRIAMAALLCALFQVFFNGIMGSAWWVSMMLILPVQLQISVVYLMQPEKNIFSAFISGIGYVFSGFGRFISNTVVAIVLYFILMFGIMYIITNVVGLTEQLHGGSVLSQDVLFFYARLNYFILPFFISMVLYMYFLGAASIIESKTGMALRKQIAGFHFRKEVYGIETE